MAIQNNTFTISFDNSTLEEVKAYSQSKHILQEENPLNDNSTSAPLEMVLSYLTQTGYERKYHG